MGSATWQELKTSVDALKARIGPVSTTADAEPWWPLALSIDDTMTRDAVVPAFRRQASHTLLWAVSDVIRTLKRSGEPNLDRVRDALTDLEGKLPEFSTTR